MSIQFTEEGHEYKSTDPKEKITWLSVTTLVKLFKKPFDKEGQAERSSQNERSKWYNMSPKDIIAAWDGEGDRAMNLGSWYHNQREEELGMYQTLQRAGLDLPIIQPIEQDGIKLSPDQGLTPGIYPEHLVYLKSAKICGQADRVEVLQDKIDLFDYKTNKEIKQKAYNHWETGPEMLLGPCAHLEDCNFNHYALQLSSYMYVMLKHNHHLKPGKMELHHIVFEIEEYDKYGYPVTAVNQDGDPIVKEVVPYEVPYLKSEVQNMIKYLRMYPDVIKTGVV